MYEQRRQHERAPLAISATASSRGVRLGQFRVVNLSAGGALFRGSGSVAVGEPIDLVITLPTGEYISTAAVVLRNGRLYDRPIFAVAFVNLPADGQGVIGRVVEAALEEMQTAYVIFVDSSEEVCRGLRERAQRCGFASFAVTTALEAMHCFDTGAKFKAALISLYLGADDGRDVLRYLGEKHPRVRRVLMSAVLNRFDLMEAAASMTSGAPAALLASSWSDSDFKLALVG